MVKSFASSILAVLTLGLAPQALKAAPLCPLGNATLHGTYVVSGSGSVTGVGPVTAVGEVTYDGQGNSSATFKASFNGTIQTVTVPGTYTVNADCTGTAEEATAHYFFVVTPDGNKYSWLETDPGTVLSGTVVRLHPLEDVEGRVHTGGSHAAPANLRRSSKADVAPRLSAGLVTQRLPRSS
jgi:hypothetical protein